MIRLDLIGWLMENMMGNWPDKTNNPRKGIPGWPGNPAGNPKKGIPGWPGFGKGSYSKAAAPAAQGAPNGN